MTTHTTILTIDENEAVKLTPKELLLLETLNEAEGKVVSRRTLMKRIWGYDRSLGRDQRRVDHLICRLRHNLHAMGARIQTVTGAGYRIAAA